MWRKTRKLHALVVCWMLSSIVAVHFPVQLGWLALVHHALGFAVACQLGWWHMSLVQLALHAFMYIWLVPSLYTFSTWRLPDCMVAYCLIVVVYTLAYSVWFALFSHMKKWTTSMFWQHGIWSVGYASLLYYMQYYSLHSIGSFGGLFCADTIVPGIWYAQAFFLYGCIPEYILLWAVVYLAVVCGYAVQTYVAARWCIMLCVLTAPWLAMVHKPKRIFDRRMQHMHYLPHDTIKVYQSGSDLCAYLAFLQNTVGRKAWFVTGESCMRWYSPPSVPGLFGGVHMRTNNKGCYSALSDNATFIHKYHLMPYTETGRFALPISGQKEVDPIDRVKNWLNHNPDTSNTSKKVYICSDLLCAYAYRSFHYEPIIFFLTDESWFEHSRWMRYQACGTIQKIAYQQHSTIWYIGKSTISIY